MVDSKETFSHFIFIAVIKNTNYFVYVIFSNRHLLKKITGLTLDNDKVQIYSS